MMTGTSAACASDSGESRLAPAHAPAADSAVVRALTTTTGPPCACAARRAARDSPATPPTSTDQRTAPSTPLRSVSAMTAPAAEESAHTTASSRRASRRSRADRSPGSGNHH